jgi:quercetin dioxygenase-like cupin family protein
MSNQRQAFTIGPGAGSSVHNPVGGEVTFKLRGEQSGGAMTIIETTVPPSQGPPLHTHRAEDEWLHVLAGEMRIRLGDRILAAPSGTSAFIPRGVAHAWQNTGRDPAILLAVLTPSGLERFFDAWAQMPAGDANADAFRALGEAVGMTVVGPPLAQSHPRPSADGEGRRSNP